MPAECSCCKIMDVPELGTDSRHTSIKLRLLALTKPAGFAHHGPPISSSAYFALVDWTGRRVKPGKRGVIAADRPPTLAQLGFNDREWQAHVLGIESRYWRAVGAVESLLAKAQAMGQRWLKGSGAWAARTAKV